jgi:hypothetical protein
MPAETVVVERIEPLLIWPNCFLVTGSRNKVVIGRHNARWTCGSSPDQVLRGKGTVIDVVDGERDLLSVCRTALSLWDQPAAEAEIREKQSKGREHRASAWDALIKRGASGKGARGTESTGEYLMVVAAGQMLPTGDPVLTILDRYSLEEIIDIRNAMENMGFAGWRYPLVERQP